MSWVSAIGPRPARNPPASSGVLYFQESMTFVKLGRIGLIVVGVVGLNLGDTRP